MFNLFKSPVVNCYTWDSAVYNYAPIKPAASFIPDWWKELPKATRNPNELIQRPTMKGCVGFTNLYKKGFIMPMWSDLAISIGEQGTNNYRYHFSCERGEINVHDKIQRGSVYPETEYQHLKIESPWMFTCTEDIEFLQTGVPWESSDIPNMSVLPGVVEYKYQLGANINIMWKRTNKNEEYLVPYNTPLCQFIPLTERKVTINLHLISKEKFLAMKRIASSTTFLSKYRTNRRVLKENGCPFHPVKM